MPKAQIPVGSIKVAANGVFGPTTWANVFYYIVTAGASTPGEVIAAAAQATVDLYQTAFGPGNFTSSWQLQYTTVTYRDADDSIVRTRVSDVVTGIGEAAAQDAQVAYLINWSTGDPRRGGKPRQYICGIPDDHIADSARVASGVVSGVSANLITWLTGLPARSIPLQLVEMSFRDGNAWRAEPVNYPILGGSLNPVVATQRRRVNRLRPH